PRDIARQHVDLEIDAVTDLGRAEGRMRQGVRDEVHAETVALDLVDRQRHPFESDRALGRDGAGELVWHAEAEAFGIPLLSPLDDLGHGIDMAGDDMPAELIPNFQRAFEIDPAADTPLLEDRARQRLSRGLHREPIDAVIDSGEANTRAGDRGAEG